MKTAGRKLSRSYGQVPSMKWMICAFAVALFLLLGGCASWNSPSAVKDSDFRARAVSDRVRDVLLRATVLSAEDSRQLFGVDVNATGVQPVWIEVENATSDSLWLLRSGTDPDYFSPLEVAWSFHALLQGERNAAIDQHFDALDFQNPIPPKSSSAGIIFTNPHYRARLLNVDLLGPEKLIPFTLFLPDPDNPPDQSALQVLAHYTNAQRENLRHTDELRKALQQIPCCSTTGNENTAGEPLNFVMVGEIADIASAMVRRGFRSDRRAFDDNQQLFGRRPDIVLRRTGRQVPSTWIRSWVAPFQFQGKPVFLAQAGRPVGGRFADSGEYATVLHPEIDEARNLLVQDLLYSGGAAKLGIIAGEGGGAAAQLPADSLESGYRTDGLRAVMFFATRPRALSEVELLDWDPEIKRREAGIAKPLTNAQH